MAVTGQADSGGGIRRRKGEFVHGSTREHSHHGCDCAPCLERYESELAKARERKLTYRGACEDCGGPTDGSNGREKAPTKCAACYTASICAEHGTRSRYSSGCSCDDCRAANRAYTQSLKGKEPPQHGNSGYTNYGCRCVVCREGRRRYQWLLTDERKRYPSYRKAAA